MISRVVFIDYFVGNSENPFGLEIAVTGRIVADFHELSCRVATQRRTKICASAYAVTRLGGQRLFGLHGAVSPPMSLARDADLAQRTVALRRGAREGETFLSVS